MTTRSQNSQNTLRVARFGAELLGYSRVLSHGAPAAAGSITGPGTLELEPKLDRRTPGL